MITKIILLSTFLIINLRGLDMSDGGFNYIQTHQLFSDT